MGEKFHAEKGYGGLWALKIENIMDVKMVQDFESYVGGLLKGIVGGARVEIVTFDGNAIKTNNSYIMYIQDAYGLRRDVLEKLDQQEKKLNDRS